MTKLTAGEKAVLAELREIGKQIKKGKIKFPKPKPLTKKEKKEIASVITELRKACEQIKE